jgi:hypothetical protein
VLGCNFHRHHSFGLLPQSGWTRLWLRYDCGAACMHSLTLGAFTETDVSGFEHSIYGTRPQGIGNMCWLLSSSVLVLFWSTL